MLADDVFEHICSNVYMGGSTPVFISPTLHDQPSTVPFVTVDQAAPMFE
jgi:hypothetical protein